MHYMDHAKISARKFNCNEEDTVRLHKLMDSSKLYYNHFMHRFFSHNMWFVSVLVELLGDSIPNTKTGGVLSTRDVLVAHLTEDHDGHAPTPQDWLAQLTLTSPAKWLNRPERKWITWINSLTPGVPIEPEPQEL